ncbi:MAG: hypothetical protein QOF55_1332 [Thermoleophilaceae bacterium]|nr:hypothetical protein [Thermoleophilaceae bacterium]
MHRRHLAALVVVALAVLTAPASGAVTSRYFRPAATGVARSSAWWDGPRHWYRERLGYPGPASLWGVVHLFEAKDALAIAHPTPGRIAAVRAFARGAERYWNPNLRPVPGYAPHPGIHGARSHTWYDDNGWWGIAFYDAYRATGDARYLASAKRALLFIDSGWDPKTGGIWWDTSHAFKAGESLAGGTLLAAYLYHETHAPAYLAMARKYITWADADFRGEDGLYDRHERDPTPMPYVEGPMALAFVVLCDRTRDQAYCREGEDLADRAAARFPTLTMGPQYDAMYARSMVELSRYDGNPRWYRIAGGAAAQAQAHAASSNGLYLLTWDGQPMSTVGTPANMLQTHAATTSVFAWLATSPEP